MSWVRLPARAWKESVTPTAKRIIAAIRVDRSTGVGRRAPEGGGGPTLRSAPSPSAALDLEIGAPVLLHALLGVLAARRPLLAVGNRGHAVLGDAVGLEVVHGRLRPPIAERQVVLGGALLVAVAFDQHERVDVLLEPRRVAGERVDRVGPQQGLVEVETDGLQLGRRDELILPRALLLGGIIGLRRLGRLLLIRG